MATVPLSGTNIRLLSGVPFNNDYKNSRWFDSQTIQEDYFLSKTPVYTLDEYNFQRIDGYAFIAVNEGIDTLWNVNYVMFQNSDYSNKWFYAFVNKVEYKRHGATLLHFQIDVLQTWMFDMDFKPSFVVREHRPLWNSDGSPVINTVDEGLNYGTVYDTVEVKNVKAYETIYFLVIVTKNSMHNGVVAKENKITPVLNGLPQPLSFYIHPFKQNGDVPNATVGGTDASLSSITETLRAIYTHDDAVNNVVALYVTEYIGYNANYDSGTDTLTFDGVTFEKASIADDVNANFNTIYMQSMPSYNAITKDMGDKYSGYSSVTESKLLMYPYTVLVMDDFKGNRQTIKTEYINNPNITITIKGSLGTSNKLAYNVGNYLQFNGIDYGSDVTLEHALINNTPSDVPILSDYLSAYLQGNRNSIENQKNSIMWNGFMSGLQATVGVATTVASGGMSMASSATRAGAGQIGARTDMSATGGAIGGVQGVGNAVLAMQAIQAKQSDISNTPPSLVKMGSNTQFDYGNGYSGMYLIKKQIKPEYKKKLSDFWNMFGYKINEVKVPNFHTRQYWNYVETKNCNIIASINNEDLRELKSIFDGGVTLWHTDDIGNYSLGNEVI